MRAFAPLTVLAFAALTGCTDSGDGRQVDSVRYAVIYNPNTYDADEASARFDDCTKLPGASFGGIEEVRPPNLFLRFDGTRSQQQKVVRCLEDLPGADVGVEAD